MSGARILGNLLGGFLILSAATANMYVSNENQRLSGFEHFILVTAYLIVSLPLIFPIKLLNKFSQLKKPLIGILILGILGALVKISKDLYWAFSYGEPLQRIMFPLLGFVVVIIMVMQYFELKSKNA